MITAELFLITNLMMGGQASYWWLVLFVISDWTSWAAIKGTFGGRG